MKFKPGLGKKVFLLILLCLLVAPVAVLADNSKPARTDNIFIPAGTVIETPYWVAAPSINLNSEMKDDVYLAGASIVVSGPIAGDLFAAGSSITVNSEINGDLRVAGGMVTINNKISGNVTVLGGMITLGPDAQVGKNIIVLGGNVEIYGRVEKNLYAVVGNLVINNEIKGDVKAIIDRDGGLILYPQAKVNGQLDYSAYDNANIYEGATVNAINYNQLKIEVAETVKKVKDNKGIVLTFWLLGLLSSLVVGLAVVYLLKNLTVKVKDQILSNIPLTILKGFLYLIVTPIALLILAVTIIGAPLALILGALYAIALCLCKIFVGVCFGDWLMRKVFKQNQAQLVWTMILGVFGLYLIFLIPFVGILAKLVVIIWGLGAIITVLKKELSLENS